MLRHTKKTFHGRCVLITGAASGIGKALVEQLAGLAGSLYLVDIDAEGLQALRHRHTSSSSEIFLLEADLSTEQGCRRMLSWLEEGVSALDFAFLNAGIAHYGHLGKVEWYMLERIIGLNFTGAIFTATNLLARWPTVHLCFTASAMAYLGLPGYSVYAATKAALHRFAEVICTENPRLHLSVVYPVATRTAFFERAGGAPLLLPSHTPTSVARKMLWGVACRQRRIFPSCLFYLMTLPVLVYAFYMKPYLAYARRLLKQYKP